MCTYIQWEFNTKLWGFQDAPVAHTHTSFYFLENLGSQSFSSSDEKDESRGAFASVSAQKQNICGSEPRLSTSRIWSLNTVGVQLVIDGVCGESRRQLAMAQGRGKAMKREY